MQNQQRHLAAILFTDIVGYTAMMQKDEQKAVTVIKRHRVAIEKSVSEHKGDVIEYFGDGSLSIFSSVTEALHCAIDVQQQLQDEPKVPLRIGLHIGEVLLEDGKVMGDGVNLASRIQSLGEAGSILFSKEIFDKIRNHIEFIPEYLGRFELKNVDEPMDVYALANKGLTIPKKDDMAGRLKQVDMIKSFSPRTKWIIISAGVLLLAFSAIFMFGLFKDRVVFTGKEKSIAVLPFNNISNDTLQQYFSDGITEDIITQLSRISDLKVISRTSVMQYKNTTKTIREIAKELNVAAILEGSVRKEGNKLRINAQLIDANTDKHIWAEQYDRDASEVFAIQSEVAQRIANQLNAKLTPEEGKRIQKKATDNIAAYEDYLRAKQLPFGEREALLKAALEKDSTFALAWAELAYTYSKTPTRNPADRPYYISKSLDAALTAVNYGPDLSETHMVLGDILKALTLNPSIAIKELNKSIKLNSNNAEAYVFLAFALMELGRFHEAEINLVKANQLDPLSYIMKVGWVSYYRYSRNAEKLMEYTNEVMLLENMQGLAYGEREIMENFIKLWYFFLKDDYDSILVLGNNLGDPALLGIAYTKTGDIAKAGKIADSLNFISPHDNAFSIGIIHAWMNEKQKAMEYLNLAYRLHDYRLISIKVDKMFDPLRNEESFKELLRKMGME